MARIDFDGAHFDFDGRILILTFFVARRIDFGWPHFDFGMVQIDFGGARFDFGGSHIDFERPGWTSG